MWYAVPSLFSSPSMWFSRSLRCCRYQCVLQITMPSCQDPSLVLSNKLVLLCPSILFDIYVMRAGTHSSDVNKICTHHWELAGRHLLDIRNTGSLRRLGIRIARGGYSADIFVFGLQPISCSRQRWNDQIWPIAYP